VKRRIPSPADYWWWRSSDRRQWRAPVSAGFSTATEIRPPSTPSCNRTETQGANDEKEFSRTGRSGSSPMPAIGRPHSRGTR